MTELSRPRGCTCTSPFRRRRSRHGASGRPGRDDRSGPGELSAPAEAAVRGYLARRPEATVVVLGEGPGTGFRRLDNGRLTWLSVLPPGDAAARRMLLPDGPRRRTVGRPGTGAGWPALVGTVERGVVVAVPGAPAGLPAGAVRDLLAVCAARFPGGALVLDALPWRAVAAVFLTVRHHRGVAAVHARPLPPRRPSGPARPGRRWLPWTAVCEVHFAAAQAA
ncbi:class I SAM-dependent methyltransferase [Streptomyces sp. NPDC020883]|uniref:class I SAM-dependent methyltransferase n=1 Tax=Streptomyces sp. NPDC020883 TaxID=3365099 RepID=UPI0037BB2CC6